ncbi:putative cytochrome P450 [Helianthus annuus]|nr:putative cytochrome P450 [Helianthus annuus]
MYKKMETSNLYINPSLNSKQQIRFIKLLRTSPKMLFSMNLFAYFVVPSFIPILVTITYLKWLSSSSRTHKNLPPSPWKLPIIRNLHLVGKNYHRSLRKLARKHGPLMLMHLGSVPVVVVSTAHAAQEILKTNELVFLDRGESDIIRKITYGGKDIALSNYGEYWRQLRSIVVLHLLSNKSVQSFQQVREEEMTLMIEKIQETCGSNSVVNFTKLILSFSNDVMCRVALGRKYNGKKFNTMVEQFKQLVVAFSVGQYIPSLSWVDELRGLHARSQKIAKEFDEFLEGVIEERLCIDTKESVDHQDRSFIDILLEKQKEDESGFQFSRDTIKAVILDIFVAATDTTFTALEWAFSELLRNPLVMKTLQKEVNLLAQGKPKINEGDIGKLEYLDAVLKETMRLHAPAPIIPRASSQDVQIMGYEIETGTRIVINVWAIGRDPAIWEEPEEFRPERFLNTSSYDYKGSHFEFIPFGAGRRGCPGTQFANTLIKLALANVVYKFDLALPGGENMDMSESTALTVHRLNHLLLVATPRSKLN